MDECKPLPLGRIQDDLNPIRVLGLLKKISPTAGACTRPLFSSTWAVSETRCTLHTPWYPFTHPKHPVNNPQSDPYPIESAYLELNSERV